jgi:hypothetical protein
MDSGFYDFIVVFIIRHYMEFDLRRAPYCAVCDVFLRFSKTPRGMLELHLQNFQHLIHDRVRNEQSNRLDPSIFQPDKVFGRDSGTGAEVGLLEDGSGAVTN